MYSCSRDFDGNHNHIGALSPGVDSPVINTFENVGY